MDRTTEMLSAYACDLTYEELGPDVVDRVKAYPAGHHGLRHRRL